MRMSSIMRWRSGLAFAGGGLPHSPTWNLVTGLSQTATVWP
jgi:hypothetical protein